ncbi:hypothetical protein, partial [Actinomadura sp. RB99]|uniref:hypothetical protein n=1 Tax=Actinomadura sp. RB99 TaxID=2691577 RepID=UPI0016878FBB
MPVAAWTDEGEPLVVAAGMLRRAAFIAGFEGVEEGRGPVVAALPGTGYCAGYRSDDGLIR